MTRALGLFGLAAFFEIAGCFAFWLWLRRGAPVFWAGAGTASLIAFAVVLTRIQAPFAGRAFAAYGGIYIAASLAWLWIVEGQRPTSADAVGAAIAVIGAMVIVAFGASDR